MSGLTARGRSREEIVPLQMKAVCKVYQSAQMFFAVAGLVDDPVTHFNTAHVVMTASKNGGSIKSQAEATLRLLRQRVPREMRALKTADPQQYIKIASGERDFVSILFFGLEKGNIVATGFGLKALVSNTSIKIVPDWRSCPGVDCPKGTYIFLLGEHDAIDRYFAAGKPLESVMADAVKSLIGLEIADRPNDVQPPIDILSVDSSGANWVCHKTECPDIRK